MKIKSKTIKTLKIELQEKIAFLNENLHLLGDLDENFTVTCNTAEELLQGILENKLVKTFKIPANVENLVHIYMPSKYDFQLCNEFCIKRIRKMDTDNLIRPFAEAVSPEEWFKIRAQVMYDKLSSDEQDLSTRHKNSSIYKHILRSVEKIKENIKHVKTLQTQNLEPCYYLQPKNI